MPGKSRRRKGRRPSPSQPRKSGAGRQALVAQPPTSARIDEPLARSIKPTSTVKPPSVQYPYIATELWTIGVLAGIMLVILMVLAKVLA